VIFEKKACDAYQKCIIFFSVFFEGGGIGVDFLDGFG